MKLKQLLLLSALLITTLYLATACDNPTPVQVRCSIFTTNNDVNTVTCRSTISSFIGEIEIEASKTEQVAISWFSAIKPRDQILKMNFSTTPTGVFADTTLRIKYPTSTEPININVVVNADLTLTITGH